MNAALESKHRPGSFPWMLQQPKPPIEARPISLKENLRRVLSGEKPMWIPPVLFEVDYCWPDIILEHPRYEYDGKDWFGVDWTWVEIVGGMMVTPGTRRISSVTKWKEELEWPDLDGVDWEADAVLQIARYHDDRMHVFQCTEGLFERLHELIPFDEALAAFIEEPKIVQEFFEAVANYKIKLLQKVFAHYEPIDWVIYNDDWGTQRSGFFSNKMFEEMIFPQTKRIIDFIKENGKFVELHSCGLNEQYVPYMLEMGFDLWCPQSINDADMLKKRYGDQMSFGFAVPGLDEEGIDEKTVRERVRAFVDTYAPGGRCLAFIAAPDPAVQSAALDELYRYSSAYYTNI